MDPNSILQPDIKGTCEAVDCSAVATVKIRFPIKDLGAINLVLCGDCSARFCSSEKSKILTRPTQGISFKEPREK